jgi:cytochrome o ubiquinol oxidase operon protein cyoD
MIKSSLHTPHKSHDERKTLESYILGFALSLVFTFIPYYMVVNQIVTGRALLVTILGFAIIQMLIQIIFFLHLGRGPKPFYNIAFFVSTVGIILVVAGGSLVIMNNLHHNKAPSDQVKSLIDKEGIYQINGELTGACQGQHPNHQVTIKDGQVNPLYTAAKKCDTLTFVNEDEAERRITFGEHENHKAYGGESEYVVKKGRNKTITLSETGAYRFHDHLQQETAGVFTVAE